AFAGHRQLDPHADLALALPDRGRQPPAEAALQGLLDVAHRDPVARGRLAIDVGDHVLGGAGAVDLHVARAAGRVQDLLHLLQLVVHQVQILAIYLDHDLAADARDGFFDAILDRLAEVVDHARPLLELSAHGIDDLLLGAAGVPFALRLHDYEGFRLVGRLVVGPVL